MAPSSESKSNAFAPSLDRINRRRGYVKGNVRVVCWIFNTLRMDYSAAELTTFLGRLRKRHVLRRRA